MYDRLVVYVYDEILENLLIESKHRFELSYQLNKWQVMVSEDSKLHPKLYPRALMIIRIVLYYFESLPLSSATHSRL